MRSSKLKTASDTDIPPEMLLPIAQGSCYRLHELDTAAALLLQHGDIKKAASALGLKLDTMKVWVTMPQFLTFYDKHKQHKRAQLVAKQQKIVEKSLDKLLDAVENGEEIVQINKAGEVFRARKPVSARDLNMIAAITLDKMALLEGKGQPSEATGDRLSELIGKLERIADNPGLVAVSHKEVSMVIVDNSVDNSDSGS